MSTEQTDTPTDGLAEQFTDRHETDASADWRAECRFVHVSTSNRTVLPLRPAMIGPNATDASTNTE